MNQYSLTFWSMRNTLGICCYMSKRSACCGKYYSLFNTIPFLVGYFDSDEDLFSAVLGLLLGMDQIIHLITTPFFIKHIIFTYTHTYILFVKLFCVFFFILYISLLYSFLCFYATHFSKGRNNHSSSNRRGEGALVILKGTWKTKVVTVGWWRM